MLNENIKRLRKSKGLSQEELAIKLNVVSPTISFYSVTVKLLEKGTKKTEYETKSGYGLHHLKLRLQ